MENNFVDIPPAAIAGDTIIIANDEPEMIAVAKNNIKENINTYMLDYNWNIVEDVLSYNEAKVFCLKYVSILFDNGFLFECTTNTNILLADGDYVPVTQLSLRSKVLVIHCDKNSNTTYDAISPDEISLITVNSEKMEMIPFINKISSLLVPCNIEVSTEDELDGGVEDNSEDTIIETQDCTDESEDNSEDEEDDGLSFISIR